MNGCEPQRRRCQSPRRRTVGRVFRTRDPSQRVTVFEAGMLSNALKIDVRGSFARGPDVVPAARPLWHDERMLQLA
jgi:hypothetical protein